MGGKGRRERRVGKACVEDRWGGGRKKEEGRSREGRVARKGREKGSGSVKKAPSCLLRSG